MEEANKVPKSRRADAPDDEVAVLEEEDEILDPRKLHGVVDARMDF